MRQSAPQIAPAFEEQSVAPDALDKLVIDARYGDRQAAEALWSAVRPKLVRLGLALGVAADDVPDLVQDALLTAHQKLGAFDPALGSFRAWLATILVRRARNRWRARKRRRRLLDAFRHHSADPGTTAGAAPRAGPGARKWTPDHDAVEARLTLARLLDRLSARQREVIACYEIAELTADEAAKLLGLDPASVRSIARDARQRLSQAARREEKTR